MRPFFDYWYPIGGTRYTSNIGNNRRKDAVLSPAAERFFALLIIYGLTIKTICGPISSNARDTVTGDRLIHRRRRDCAG